MRPALSLLIVTMLTGGEPARAQDVPPKDVLDAILPQLRKKLPATEILFRAPTNRAETGNMCGMQRAEMTSSFESGTRSFSVLINPQADVSIKPRQVLARIHRITVDADGAGRAYHPEDPYGEGICTRVAGLDGTTTLAGVCALDEFSSGGIRVFLGSKPATKVSPRGTP